MRRCKLHWLARSASLIALASAANVAAAQTTPAADPAPAPPAAADDAGNEVVVTGFRAALERAQEIKRFSPVVVEAITFEDLGKFTDASLSDALQRVPGVNIERGVSAYNTRDGVTIRGLGPSYSNTTINGRLLLGSPNFGGGDVRQFDFSSIPPDVLGGVTVYKTSAAGQIEPGMAGQVNLDTLRPLDFKRGSGKQFFGAASIALGKSSGTNQESPRLSGVVGARLFNDTLGIYVGGLTSKEYQHRAQYFTYTTSANFSIANTSGPPTPVNNAFIPYGFDTWDSHPEYTRQSIAAGLQWRPSSQLEVNLDFLNTYYRQFRDDASVYFEYTGVFSIAGDTAAPGTFVLGGEPSNNPGGGVSSGGIVRLDTRGMPVTAGTAHVYAAQFRHDTRTHFRAYGANVVWKSPDEHIKIAGDFSHDQNLFTMEWIRPYAVNGDGNDAIFDGTGVTPNGQYFNTGNDPSKPNSYVGIAFNEHFQRQLRQSQDAFKADLEVALSPALKLLAGGRYAKIRSQYVSMISPLSPTSTAGYFDSGTTAIPYLPFRIPNLNLNGFCANNTAFCYDSNFGKGSFVGDLPTTAAGKPGDVYTLDTQATFGVTERNLAFYGQASYDGGKVGVPLSGNIGLRAVRITEIASAFQGVATRLQFGNGTLLSQTTSLFTDRNQYWEFLPSANLTFKPASNINIRVGAARTISLADYAALAPRGIVNIVLPLTPGGGHDPSTATIGNTRLRPSSAWSFDLTGEYYTSYGGSFVVSLFYKKVKDLLAATTQIQVPIPGQPANSLFDVSTVVNSDRGRSYGFEIGTNQPFKFLPSPWDGFGITANYTYVDSVNYLNGIAQPFAGTSKHNVNVSAYYEKYGFSARASFFYRTKSLTALGAGYPFIRPLNGLDVSLGYKFNDHIELQLTGSNVTKKGRSEYSQLGGFLTGYYEQPSTYTAALRFSF